MANLRHPFSQSEFMDHFASKTSTQMPYINEGCCYAFCMYLAWHVLKRGETNLTAIAENFKKNVDGIVRNQQLMSIRYEQNNTDYIERSIRSVGLQPYQSDHRQTLDFMVLPVATMMLHIFSFYPNQPGSQSTETHALLHIRFTNETVYTFDPNFGFFDEFYISWDRWMKETLAEKYGNPIHHFLYHLSLKQ